MTAGPSNASRPPPVWAVRLAPVVFLLLLLGAARFARLQEFGFYEDDLTIIPAAVQMPPDRLLEFIADYVVGLRGQGRPLHHSFIRLLSWAGWSVGGLNGIYLVGYAVVCANVVLVYHLGRRLRSPSFGFLSGLLFAVYSADTTQAYLTHSLGLQPALMLLLLAFHAHLSRKEVLGHGLAGLALFTYESTYPVFLAAPLIRGESGSPLGRRLMRHALVMGGWVAVAVWLRSTVAGDRIGELGATEAVLVPLRHVLVGPLVSLGSYLLRPVQTVVAPPAQWAVPALLALPALVWALKQWGISSGPEREGPGQGPAGPAHRPQPAGEAAARLPASRIVIASLALTGLAYLFTFGLRSFAISGRATRVHFAAGLGACLIAGALGEALLRRPWRI
ncbi:MAG: hypothetical protein ACRDHY_04830, partial [Anaerolineales bacterium]